MTTTPTQPISEALRAVFKRLHYPIDVMLTCVRWYVAYPLSLRHIEEIMAERGVNVDHATIHRWALKMLPILALVCRRRKLPVGGSWRMALGQPLDETYVKVTGQWKYLCRAVDRQGDTVDFLFSAKRDLTAARRFLERAIGLHGLPEKITIDKSGANIAAIQSVIADTGAPVQLRQSKYLNNIVEQDHRFIKRIIRPMLGFKSFRCARIVLTGIETMRQIRKGQLRNPRGQAPSAAEQFYSLAL